MKSILFSHSYFLRLDSKQWKTGQPYAPLGTLYAAALMRANGYSVSLFDTMFAHTPGEVVPVLQAQQPDFFVIYDDGFNYLTKMCLTNMREAAFEMIRYARQKGCTVIVSSSDATDHFDMYLQAGADFVLLGEAEMTLLELAGKIDKGETDYTTITGIAFISNDIVVTTPRRPVMKELDALPFPAWDLADLAPYKAMWMQSTGYFSVNIGTTRGCPFKCNWCAKPIYGNRYNSRSPENVVKEISLLHAQHPFDHIWFCDDIFGLKPGWVHEFAGLVTAAGLQLRFKIQSRADLLLQEENIKDLHRAGCVDVWMGAESGSQKILDAMDKGTTIEEIRQATTLLKKHGINPSFFIQFGYPGETKEDIRKTIRLINELLPGSIGISVSYPLPGTRFYENVKSQLKTKTNWTDSDELKILFRNTYQPGYYKQLHRYTHKTYRMHLALHTLRRILSAPLQTRMADIKKAASLLYYAPATISAASRLRTLEAASTHDQTYPL